ncbi:unnamed protein product [Caretta caretta]
MLQQLYLIDPPTPGSAKLEYFGAPQSGFPRAEDGEAAESALSPSAYPGAGLASSNSPLLKGMSMLANLYNRKWVGEMEGNK